MVITLTPLSKSQWKKVGQVAFWVVLSLAPAGAIALLTKNDKWLATLPGWNVFGVMIKQVLTQEQAAAEAHLPADAVAPVQEAADAVNPAGA